MNIPPLDKRVALQPARYLSQLSIIGWKEDWGNLYAERGKPRYVWGKVDINVPRMRAID
jgi:hypothetical protein